MVGNPKRRDARTQRSWEGTHLRSKRKPPLIFIVGTEVQRRAKAVVEASPKGSFSERLVCNIVWEIEYRATKEDFPVRHESPASQVETRPSTVRALVDTLSPEYLAHTHL